MNGKHLRNFVIGVVLGGLGLAVVNITPFTAGTPIKASEVNANFSALRAAVEALQANGGTAYTAGAGLSLSGTTFSVANSGIVAAMLADGAVGTAKLADGAVTGAKVASASLPSAKLTDGPGIAAQLQTGNATTISSSVSTLQTVTLSAPGPGYIVVEASGYTTLVATGTASVIFSISKTTAQDGAYQSTPGVVTAQTIVFPFAIHRVEQVGAAGNVTFNLLVQANGSFSLASVGGARLIATFVPAAYGAVGTN